LPKKEDVVDGFEIFGKPDVIQVKEMVEIRDDV
jgi:hypothetical protein